MFNLEAAPINFRVIGFGRETEDAIKQLRNLGYDGLSAEVFNPELPPCVTSDDMMIILLISGQCEDAVTVSESFKEAGVLTLAVCSEGIEMPSGYVDSQTQVSAGKMSEVAKAILDIIFIPSLIAIAFNDIDNLLRNSGTFKAAEGIGSGENRMQDALTQLNSNRILSSYKNAMVCIYTNINSTQPLVMDEMQSLDDVINKLPDNINIIWGVSNDRTLTDGTVRISLITTKNIIRN